MKKLEELAGKVLMVGLPHAPRTPEFDDWLRTVQPGGILLFRRHCSTAESTADLVAAAANNLNSGTLFAIDQEGGRVNRLQDWLGVTPTAAVFGERGSEAAFHFGRETGLLLRKLGFNLNFAPVVDLSPADRDNGIGSRAWSVDPQITSALAGAYLEGLQGSGVAGCLKHFPGLGETFVDSHVQLPRCERSLAQLESAELLPFSRLSTRASSVMVSHALYPALDENMPASLSHVIIQQWLKQKLSFEGLVISDDLEMGAVSSFDSEGGAAIAAIHAGCDLLIYGNQEGPALRAKKALINTASSDGAFKERLSQAADRVEQMAARWPAATATDPKGAETAWNEAVKTDPLLRA